MHRIGKIKGNSTSSDFKIQCDVDDNGDGSGNGDQTCTAMRRTPLPAPVWLNTDVRSQK